MRIVITNYSRIMYYILLTPRCLGVRMYLYLEDYYRKYLNMFDNVVKLFCTFDLLCICDSTVLCVVGSVRCMTVVLCLWVGYSRGENFSYIPNQHSTYMFTLTITRTARQQPPAYQCCWCFHVDN